jgi:hypothetical protein
MKRPTEPEAGLTQKPWWKDLDAARAEVAQCHGLLSRLYGVLRLAAPSGNSFVGRIQALEEFCKQHDAEVQRLFPRGGAPRMPAEDGEMELLS